MSSVVPIDTVCVALTPEGVPILQIDLQGRPHSFPAPSGFGDGLVCVGWRGTVNFVIGQATK